MQHELGNGYPPVIGHNVLNQSDVGRGPPRLPFGFALLVHNASTAISELLQPVVDPGVTESPAAKTLCKTCLDLGEGPPKFVSKPDADSLGQLRGKAHTPLHDEKRVLLVVWWMSVCHRAVNRSVRPVRPSNCSQTPGQIMLRAPSPNRSIPGRKGNPFVYQKRNLTKMESRSIAHQASSVEATNTSTYCLSERFTRRVHSLHHVNNNIKVVAWGHTKKSHRHFASVVVSATRLSCVVMVCYVQSNVSVFTPSLLTKSVLLIANVCSVDRKCSKLFSSRTFSPSTMKVVAKLALNEASPFSKAKSCTDPLALGLE